jgi:hypothetical protein
MENNKIVFIKEFIYFLGFLWADGFIERNRIGIEILEDDARTIIDDISKIDFLKICTMNRHRKDRRPQMTIYFCNSKMYDTYFSKYFTNKSISAPISLLEAMPSELRRYFYLGLIDGDGCFYFNEKNKIRQFYITSSFDQDWSHIINLFDEINVNQYEIRKIENKNGNRSSYIRVKKYNEIQSIFNYLYPNGYEFGLKRKFDKCKSIIDIGVKNNSNKSKICTEELTNKIESGLNILELSLIFECHWRKIYNHCKNNNIPYRRGFFKGV